MIRKDLISPLQQTVPGIILLVLRRWNQQFDELGASLHCFTGLKGKLLFWITAVAGSHKTAVLAGGRVCSRAWDEISTNSIRKKKTEIVNSVRLSYEGGDKNYFRTAAAHVQPQEVTGHFIEKISGVLAGDTYQDVSSPFEKGTESSTPTERARGPAEDWHLNAAFFFKPSVCSSGLVDTNASRDPSWGTDWIPCALQQTPPLPALPRAISLFSPTEWAENRLWRAHMNRSSWKGFCVLFCVFFSPQGTVIFSGRMFIERSYWPKGTEVTGDSHAGVALVHLKWETAPRTSTKANSNKLILINSPPPILYAR